MKTQISFPQPDKIITGLNALKVVEEKSKKDRKIFNRAVQNSRKSEGFGVSLFSARRWKDQISFDLGVTTREGKRIDGIEFILLRYEFPSNEEGLLEFRSLFATMVALIQSGQISTPLMTDDFWRFVMTLKTSTPSSN